MNLATANDLTRWADLREAQGRLPQLVRRLVSATANGLTKLSMRAGEGVGIPGWDGVVVAQDPDAHVPAGKSVWEMGVNVDPAAKANKDYRERTNDPKGVDPAETIFVFVTPRTWRDKESWVRRKKEEGVWKDVVAYDGDDLETWLERAPAVHIWISALLGKDPYEAESIDTWWDSWSRATLPALPPTLLLSGRKETAEQVRKALLGVPAALALSSDSQEEAVAFVAAVLINNAETGPQPELERTVVVRTAAAWRRLAVSDRPLILLPLYEKPDVTLATSHGHHVLIPLGPEVAAISGLEIPRLRRHGIEAALTEAGLSADRATALATLGRRSLLSLRRALAISPEIQAPEWSRPENARVLLPAMLAGKWRDDSVGDRAAISELAGRPYDEVVEGLTRWAKTSDPPVRRVGKVWMIAAKQDAWVLMARFLTSDDFKRLRRVAEDVLGGDDPSLDLPPRERILAPILNKERAHSGHLIEGLADTLALMASTSDQVPLSDSRRGQDEANTIVYELLKAANDDLSGRRWITLSNALPLLAEAAPDVFLRAVDNALRGDPPVALKLFQDGEGFDAFFSDSAHTGLLWALENLVWSPEYLARAALLLGKLTRIDPGGRLGNRPAGSLRSVLLLRRAGTAATLDQRLQAVDQLRKRESTVAWRLILALIPGNEAAFSTHTPSWREWKPEKEATLYTRDLVQAVDGLITRALEDVGIDGDRWAGLLGRIDDLLPDTRAKVIDQLEKLEPGTLTGSGRAALVGTLRDLVGRHRQYVEADWAMPQPDIDRLAGTIDLFEPDEPEAKHAWLFGQGAMDWFGGGERDEQRNALVEAQTKALSEIYEKMGIEGILGWSQEFVSTTFSAHQVGWALGRIKIDENSESNLFEALVSDSEARRVVAAAYVAQVGRSKGAEWLSWAKAILGKGAQSWSSAKQAAFLTALPATPELWDLAESLGEQTDRDYWQGAHHHILPGGDVLSRAANKLLQHGRPYTAIYLLGLYANAVETNPPYEVAAQALEQALQVTPPEYLDNMFSYNVGRLLDRLEKSGLDERRLAALEWAYLPIFRFDKRRSGILHQALATEPSFFVEIVTLMYRAKGEEPRDLSEEEQARARTAGDLLDSWQLVPGTKDDGTIDRDKLGKWVTQSRKLLSECGRLEAGDHRIGRMLRYGTGPSEDPWPPEPVRDLIEEVASEELEDGFMMEVYNSRGSTSRSLTAGGQQERGLAAHYRSHAASVAATSHRTAAMLSRIADSYEHDATRHDVDADLTEDFWR